MRQNTVFPKSLSIILALVVAVAWLPVNIISASPDGSGVIPPGMSGSYVYASYDDDAIAIKESDSHDDPPYDGGIVPDEVLAPADSLEHAQAIADAYGLELKSYAYGIAVLAATDPVLTVAGSGNTRGIPKLSLNRLHHLFDTADIRDFEKDTHESMPTTSDLRVEDAETRAEQVKTRVGKMESRAEHEKIRAEQMESNIFEQESPVDLYELIQWHRTEMDADRAWSVSTGQNVIIAIIDTGIDTYSPAFTGKISDKSYNSHTNEIGLQYVYDDHPRSHGTHVSGIAAAAFGIIPDVSGIAPAATILTVKANVTGEPDELETASWLRGLNYAVANGAQVVNMSFGDSYYEGESDIEHIVIANAVAEGVTLVCASGNSRESHAAYPAAYPECIAVSATKQGYAFAEFSNYGPEIAISAPGESIYSTIASGWPAYRTGTSMAAPNVVGVAALVISLHPEYTPQQVREVLCGTARDVGVPGRDDYFGHGIVNAYAAVLGIDSLYSVTYDLNDGISELITTRVIPDSILAAPSNPIRDGYTFDGWYISGTNEEFEFGSPVQGNIKLYATWVELSAGMYILEFPDTNFRNEVLRLLNAMDGGKRKASSLIESDLAMLASIKSLYMYSMSIYDATGLKYFTGLESFGCEYNYLSTLDVTKNAALKYLSLWNNNLTELDVSGNPNLETLECSYNQLTALDTSQSTLLQHINCYGNRLTALDVSNNNALVSLNCSDNRLTELNIANNTLLKWLYCYDNILTRLDVSNNTDLNYLHCLRNYIKSVDLVTGWQTNPGLVLDNSFIFYPQYAKAVDITDNFTDPNFRAAVYEEIGKDNSERIYDYDVEWIDRLDVYDRGIQSLAGLEWFTGLRNLICGVNQLASLPDLPNGLNYLYYWDNQLVALPELPDSLIELDCGCNRLTTLPTLPENMTYLCCEDNLFESFPKLPDGLEYLYCWDNRLAALPDLPDSLINLDCDGNLLTALLKLPDNLEYLKCDNNQLTSLPELPDGLETLSCSYNQLETLPALPDDMVSLFCDNNQLTSLPKLPDGLENLYCSYNRLTSLPVLPDGLESLDCCGNRLVGFDVIGLSLLYLDCRYNYIKSIVHVTGWQSIPWLVLDESFLFYPQNSDELDITDDFTDTSFLAAVYNTTGKTAPERICFIDVEWITVLDIPDMGIQSLAGLEWFVNLERLYCEFNNLTVLDVSKNTELVRLYCHDNYLTELIVSADTNPNLSRLYCYNNYLKSPDLFVGWMELGLVINTPQDIDSGTYRYYIQNTTSGVSVTGAIRSYNPRIPTVIRLMQGDIEMYKATIDETAGYGQVDQQFMFDGVAPGTYSLVISKAVHTRFTVENVVVGDEDVDLTEDIRPEVCLMTLLYGDINGDGEINQTDLNILWLPDNYNKITTDGVNTLCDLNGDGEINQLDLNILWLPSNYNKGAVLIK